MRDRLTKAQVEALLSHLDGPVDELVAAIASAVAELHGPAPLDQALRGLGRAEQADALAAGDPQAAWDLATELNETRHLPPRP